MIDAYLHAGGPRFGSAELAMRELDRHDITRGIVVLPPACPDFEALRCARELKGDAVRLVGIPFGESEAQRAELTEWQIAFGVLGLRMMPGEIDENPTSLQLIGEAGRWLFAINPYQSTATVRLLLDWLEKHPAARIASPHFIKPAAIADTVEDPTLFRQLLEHPRFFIILSRQGATGTTQPFPHPDLRPWIEDVTTIAGWEKVMWGSEYPVLYWRDEQIPQAANWIRELLPALEDTAFSAFIEGNARRIFFNEPASEDISSPLPDWMPPPPHQGWPVPIAQKGIRLSADANERIAKLYLEANTPESPVSLSDFMARWIEERL